MKVSVISKVTISASRAEIFKYLQNPKYHYLWNPALQTIEPLAPLKPGLVYKATRMVLGKRLNTVNKVVKLVKDRELELENTTGLIHYNVNYSLTDKNGKTLLCCNTTVDSSSKAFAFTKPILELLARRELQSDLQALKLAVEQNLHTVL